MDSVKVAIRIRPLIAREQGSDILWTADTCQIRLKEGKSKPYFFDRVFDSAEISSEVYEEIVEPIVQSAMGGFNGTVFAYGQTSSGKTYTMMGDHDNPGIIPLSVNDTFSHIQKMPEREFLLRVSYMEIYNEVVKDLLAPNNDGPGLQIREDEFRNAKVQGLTEKLVMSSKDVLKLMETGDKKRHTGCTNMNERSSRSHTIFRMIIESRERMEPNTTRDSLDTDSAVKVSQLNLVDLAGSERASQTGAEGQRLKEGCHINKSLSTLGLVINQICKASETGQGAQFISYRDSKLTRILQPSLGGNSLTAIICAVTPASLEDTDSTLRFASSAKKIKNKPHVNEVLSDEALLYRQKREINQLKKKIQELELNSTKKQTAELETMLEQKNQLQKEQEDKIQMLKKIILVSTQPADSTKRQRTIRRETWCPGKLALAPPLTPQLRRSPRMDSSFANQSSFFQKLDHTLIHSDFEPIARKKARFMDDPTSSSMAMTPGSKLRADQASDEFSTLEDEIIQMRKKQEDLEEELAEAKASKNKLLQEKESVKMKMMKMQGQISAQSETLDEVIEEKNLLEEEKGNLELKIKNQSQQISDYIRREKKWENSNPDVRMLRNENQDLCDQLRDVCSQNRKLQEKADEERDSIDCLQSMLEQVNKEAKEKEESLDSQLEEYKNQVSTLQTQLEATFANNTHSPTALVDVHKLEEEVKTYKQDLEKKNLELEEEKQKNMNLELQLEKSVLETSDKFKNLENREEDVEKQEEIENLLRMLEEQAQVNGDLKRQLEQKQEDSVFTEKSEVLHSEVENLKNDLENLKQELIVKDQEILEQKKLLEQKAMNDCSVNESIKVGEKTFGEALTQCETLIEQRDAARNECNILQEELDKLRTEKEAQSGVDNDMNKSGKLGEKSMMINDALSACEDLMEERDEAKKECEKMRAELDQMTQKMATMLEHEEFIQAEKDILFEQEKENLQEIEVLQEKLMKREEEIEKIKTRNTDSENSSSISAENHKDAELQHLREEVCNLLKSSEDAQEMLQDANKNLAVAHTTADTQQTKIDELEKELSRVKSDVESFDTQAEFTKDKYEKRINELSQQLQKAYDQLGSDGVPQETTNTSSQLKEYKVIVDEKETEIQNLSKKLESSSKKLEELQIQVENYEEKMKESNKSGIQDQNPPASADSQRSDADIFLSDRNLSVDDLKSALEEMENLRLEKSRIMEEGSKRISELEEALNTSKGHEKLTEEMNEKVLKFEKEIEERDNRIEILQKESESVSGSKNQLEELQKLLNEKNDEYASLLSRMDVTDSLIAEKDEIINRLESKLEDASKEQNELVKRLDDSLFSNEDSTEKNLRELLATARKELAEMTEKNLQLHTVTEHAQGALLAEENRELDQQRLLEISEKQRRESALVLASERESANKQINELLAKVNELQTALCKSNVEKDVVTRQSDKMTQECEFLHQQVKNLENIHNKEVSVIPRGQAMDPDKMAVKIKQLSLNLELTKQTSDKLSTTNKQLQDENRRLENEVVKVISLRGDVTRLEAILEQERKTRQEDVSRQVIRENESTEMRNKIVELQKEMREAEEKSQMKFGEDSLNINTLKTEKNHLQEEVGMLKQRIVTLEGTIQDLKNKEENFVVKLSEQQDNCSSLEEKLEKMNSEKSDDDQKIVSLEERLAHSVRLLEDAKLKFSQSDDKNLMLIEELNILKEDLESKQRIFKDEENKNVLLQQNLDQVKQKLDAALQEAEGVRSEILAGERSVQDEVRKNLEDLRVKLEEKRQENEELSRKMNDLVEKCRMEVSDKDSGYKQLQEEHNNLIQSNDSLKCSLQDLEDKYSKLEEEFKKIISEKDSHTVTHELNYKALQEEHNTLLQEKDVLRTRIMELESAVESKILNEKSSPAEEENSNAESLLGKISDLESELEEMILAKEELAKFNEDAKDNYEKSLDEIKASSQEKDEEISRLKENINSEESSGSDSLVIKEELDSLKVSLSQKQDEIESYKKIISELEAKCETLRAEISSRKESTKDDDGVGFAASLDQELLENLSDQVAEYKLQLEEKDEQISDLNVKIRSLESGLNNPTVNDHTGVLENEVDDLKIQIQDLKAVIKTKEVEMLDIQSNYKVEESSLQKQGHEEAQDVSNLKDDISRLSELLKEKDTLILEFQTKLEDAKVISDGLKKEIEILSSSREEKDAELSSLRQQLSCLYQKTSENLSVKNAEIMKLSSELNRKKQEIQVLEEKNRNLQASVLDNQDKSFDKEAKGDQESHTANLEERECRIEHLHNQLEEKDQHILNLTKLKEDLEMNISSLKKREEDMCGSRWEDKCKIEKLESLRSSEEEAMVELKQQLLTLSKSLEKEDARIIELKRTKEEIHQEMLRTKEENENLIIQLEEIAKLRSELEDRESQIALLKNAESKESLSNEISKEKEYLEKKCACLQETISSLEAMIEQFKEEQNESALEMEKLQEEASSLTRSKDELEFYKVDLESQLEERTSKAEKLEKDQDSHMKKIAELQVDLQLEQEKSTSLDSELNSVYEMIKDKAALMEESASSREALEKDVDNLKMENHALKTQLEETDDTILKSELKDAKKENIELMNKIKNTEIQVQELQSNLDKAAETKNSLEIKLAESNKNITSLEESMNDAVDDIQSLTTKVASLTERNESLTSKLDEVDSEKASLEDRLKQAKDSLSSDLKMEKESQEGIRKELESIKVRFETAAAENETASQEIEALNSRIAEMTKTHKDELESVKLKDKTESEQMDDLRKQLASHKKDSKHKLEEVKGLLYKKELEVQSLKSDIDSWACRYEQIKTDLENAVKLAKDEIAAQNEKTSLQMFEMEEKLQKAYEFEKECQNLREKCLEVEKICEDEKKKVSNLEAMLERERLMIESSKEEVKSLTLDSRKYEKCLQELEQEKGNSKDLTEKIAVLEAEFAKKLKETMEKAKRDHNKLELRIESLEEGLFESDKELEDEKAKYLELMKKFKESEKNKEIISTSHHTRSSDKMASELESVKDTLSKSEEKYKEEKQKTQQLMSQLRSEKRRCAELVARLEDITVRKQTKFPGVDTSDAAKELFMEREKTKDLTQKLTDRDFSKKMKEVQERSDASKKILQSRINELEENCIEADQEAEEWKKKYDDLEEMKRNLEQQMKKTSTRFTRSKDSSLQDKDLQKQLGEKDNMITQLKIKLTSTVEPLEREVGQLKEELKMSEERITKLKQEIKFMPQTPDEVAPAKTRSLTATRSTRSSAAAAKRSYHGGSGGLVVQDTKVYVLEMEIADNQRRMKFLEKELAKYKDIETKRRTENMELLEENKKFRTIIKKVRDKKDSSADILSENSNILNQPTASARITRSKELPTSQSNQEDKCKNQ